MVSRMFSRLEAERRFTSPYAPGFCVFGARLKPDCLPGLDRSVYVLGKGRSEEVAHRRLCGEAAERASVHATGATALWHLADPLRATRQQRPAQGWADSDGRLRSHGAAAHNLADQARFAAASELMERRSIDEWWRGRRDTLWLGSELAEDLGLDTMVATWRAGAHVARRTGFALLGAPLAGISTAVAFGDDGAGGQMAAGFAAAPDAVQAIFRALEELLSVELETADLVRARLDGDTILPGSARAKAKARAAALAARHAADSQAPRPITPERLAAPGATRLGDLAQAAEAEGMPVRLVDMTRADIGIPVFRAVFDDPALTPFRIPAPGPLPL